MYKLRIDAFDEGNSDDSSIYLRNLKWMAATATNYIRIIKNYSNNEDARDCFLVAKAFKK